MVGASVEVLLRKNAMYTLNAYKIGAGGISLVTGDFNGDGNQDVVVTDTSNGANRLDVGLGDGSGKLTWAGIITLSTPPAMVATADLNGDGKPDLVTTSNNGVDVILNTTP
jgi:hypothetical protein